MPTDPHVHDTDPRAGWEPRVVLDFTLRRLITGLRERPTQKPLLLFLPKGASVSLLKAFLVEMAIDKIKTVCLVEDESIAVLLDGDPEMSEDIRKTTRFVIGDLKSLAKTDKDCYGGCVVFAYACDMPPNPYNGPVLYLDDKVSFIAKLCGWSAHVICLDQPFRDAPDELIQDMAERPVARRVGCELTASQHMSVFGSHFRAYGRSVTMVSGDLAGSDRNAAVCLYLQIFRTSGKGPRRVVSQAVRAAIFETVTDAVSYYKGEAACKNPSDGPDWSPCLFMSKLFYDAWVSDKKSVPAWAIK